MPPAEAIEFLVTDPDGVSRCLQLAAALLPSLPADSLVDLAKYFDPGRPSIRAIYNR